MSDGLGYKPSSPPIVLDKTQKPKPPIDRTPFVELVGVGTRDDDCRDPMRSLTVVLHDAPWQNTVIMYHNCPVSYRVDANKLQWCTYDRADCVVTWC